MSKIKNLLLVSCKCKVLYYQENAITKWLYCCSNARYYLCQINYPNLIWKASYNFEYQLQPRYFHAHTTHYVMQQKSEVSRDPFPLLITAMQQGIALKVEK